MHDLLYMTVHSQRIICLCILGTIPCIVLLTMLGLLSLPKVLANSLFIFYTTCLMLYRIFLIAADAKVKGTVYNLHNNSSDLIGDNG